MIRTSIALVGIAALITLTGCDKKEPVPSSPAVPAPAPQRTTAAPTTPPSTTAPTVTPPAATTGPFPATLFLTAAPADAKDIKETKPTLKPGDNVVLTGRIGGSGEPFVDGRAIFTLVDRRLPACGEEEGAEDHCPTPWDYCCEERSAISENSATVRVVGPDGQPLKSGLQNVGGLKPLSKVTVVGKVAEAQGPNLVVNASGFFVTP